MKPRKTVMLRFVNGKAYRRPATYVRGLAVHRMIDFDGKTLTGWGVSEPKTGARLAEFFTKRGAVTFARRVGDLANWSQLEVGYEKADGVAERNARLIGPEKYAALRAACCECGGFQ